MLTEYAKSHNFSEIKHYSDEGVSGTKFDRPALNELLREAEAGNIATVIVKDVSRIGRSMASVLNIVAELKKNNVRVSHLILSIFSFPSVPQTTEQTKRAVRKEPKKCAD